MRRALRRLSWSHLGLLFVAAGLGCAASQSAARRSAAIPLPADDAELTRLHDEDQADRVANVHQIDWAIVGKRDQARLARVKELYERDRLRTGSDYYHAAVILQHGPEPEDFLLAHELCVVALIKGKNDKDTRVLAAGSEDRFLLNIGRKQRFATQFTGELGGPMKLQEVDLRATDALRRVFDAHTLVEAHAYEAELNRK